MKTSQKMGIRIWQTRIKKWGERKQAFYVVNWLGAPCFVKVVTKYVLEY